MPEDTPEDGYRLTLPTAWVEELAAEWEPQLAGAPDALWLSYSPKSCPDLHRDSTQVELDLANGMWLVPRRAENGAARFQLRGTEHTLQLRCRNGEQHQQPMAVVQQVEPSSTLPRKAGQFYLPVKFRPVWEEQPCDIVAVYEWLRHPQRLRQARSRAAKVLHRPAPMPGHKRRTHLHAEVRRQYGELETLLALLWERAEQECVTANGVVVTPPGRRKATPYLWIHVQGSGQPFADQLVEITDDTGEKLRTRAHEVRGDRLALERPSRGLWPVGRRVRVTTRPRFGMRPHRDALKRFLEGDVEGNWERLATLLCLPGRLRARSRQAEPAHWFCDEPGGTPLNHEQRKAVSGALTSSQGYFIQGPPGTGKTEVICELVRQLVARGERVLMLAPTHVAVDEVLHRIGSVRAIRPLRLAWNDSKVAEDLRRFLPERAGESLAATLRRPESSQSARWHAEQARVDAELAAIRRLREAAERSQLAGTTLEMVTPAAEAADQRLREFRLEHARGVQRLQRAVADSSAQIEETRPLLETARQEERAAIAALQLPLPKMAAVAAATEELMESSAGDLSAEQALAAAEAESRRRTDQQRELHQQLAAERDRLRALVAAAKDDITSTTTQLAEIERQLHAAEESQGQARRWLQATLSLEFGRAAGLRTLHREHMETLGRQQERLRAIDADQRALHVRIIEQYKAAAVGRHHHEQVVSVARDRHQQAGAAGRMAMMRWLDTCAAAGGDLSAKPNLDDFHARLERFLQAPKAAPPPAEFGHMVALGNRLARIRSHRTGHEQEIQRRVGQRDHHEAELDALRSRAEPEHARLERDAQDATAELRAARQRRTAAESELDVALRALGYSAMPGNAELERRQGRLQDRGRQLARYLQLERRWLELTAASSDEELGQEIRDALVRSVNLVCATTTGIAARGSRLVNEIDFDTLIVDEASKVTDSEFLIGAVRARRWVLVGDEHQLPPYVEPTDEHHLHALAALYRFERAAAPTLEAAVRQLADLWHEDEEQHRFRNDSVRDKAIDVRDSGVWDQHYRDSFIAAHDRMGDGDDADRKLLATMRRYLVRSLFERGVRSCPATLRQRLVEQRRMVDPLAEIVRQPVYRGDYRTAPEEELRRLKVTPLTTPVFSAPAVLLDTSSYRHREDRQDGTGFVNEFEAELVLWACQEYDQTLANRSGQPKVDVSILSFYRAQARLIDQQLDRSEFPRLNFKVIDAIDRIQGQQSDLVILSFTRTYRGRRPTERFGVWLQDLRRLNVACTRARRALVLVGRGEMLRGLRASEEAQAFYTHLLGLFATRPSEYLTIKDF